MLRKEAERIAERERDRKGARGGGEESEIEREYRDRQRSVFLTYSCTNSETHENLLPKFKHQQGEL